VPRITKECVTTISILAETLPLRLERSPANATATVVSRGAVSRCCAEPTWAGSGAGLEPVDSPGEREYDRSVGSRAMDW
jgi:hypothetical protein